jgi:hypothetical protein
LLIHLQTRNLVVPVIANIGGIRTPLFAATLEASVAVTSETVARGGEFDRADLVVSDGTRGNQLAIIVATSREQLAGATKILITANLGVTH